jgi:hypothetical protein
MIINIRVKRDNELNGDDCGGDGTTSACLFLKKTGVVVGVAVGVCVMCVL